MATAAVLTERAESLGLPITKNAFEGTLENPVPPLPYMVCGVRRCNGIYRNLRSYIARNFKYYRRNQRGRHWR